MLKILGATVQNMIARGLLHSCFNISPTIHSPVFRKVSFLQAFPQKPSTHFFSRPFLPHDQKALCQERRTKLMFDKLVQWIAYGLEEQKFEFRKEASFLFSKTSRPTLGPTEPQIQLVPELLPWRDLTTQFHLVPRLRMSAATPLLPLHSFKTWTGTSLPLPSLHCWNIHIKLRVTCLLSAQTEWKSNSKITFSRHNLSILKHAQKEWWLVML